MEYLDTIGTSEMATRQNFHRKQERQAKAKASKMKQVTTKQSIQFSIKNITTLIYLTILLANLLLGSALICLSASAEQKVDHQLPTLEGSQKQFSINFQNKTQKVEDKQHVTSSLLLKPPKTATPTTVIIQQQFNHSGMCAMKTSCRQKSRRRDLDVGPELSKHLCYCDQSCVIYDDCCPDSSYSQEINERIKLGADNLERIRSEWHCHKVNPIFGDVLLKASCPSNWLTNNEKLDINSAQLIKRRCEYVKDRGKQRQQQQQQQQGDKFGLENDTELDPVGMMMPITDLSSGITYANSYCLRCNLFSKPDIQSILSKSKSSSPKSRINSNQAPKLIYWSPLLECSYNLENDEKNTLIDLINSNKGQVLQYSSKINKWILSVNEKRISGNETATVVSNRTKVITTAHNNERVCSITPTTPESVEHIIRYCKSEVINKCSKQTDLSDKSQQITRDFSTYTIQERAEIECKFGHQSLAFGSSSNAVYYNPACAICNNERQVSCEPKLGKNLLEPLLKKIIYHNKKQNTTADQRVVFSPPAINSETSPPSPDESPSTESPDQDSNNDDLDSAGAASSVSGRGGSQQIGNTVSGSFSVLMDLYGSSQGDEQVGSVHQCPDSQNQVYDPFFLTCRDIVCGLNHQFVEGKCVSLSAALKDNLVEKFEPAMAYITTICLIISIAGLAIYLLLYCLSMFDLRHLVVDMNQELGQDGQNSTLTKQERIKRASRVSEEMHSTGGSSSSGASRSHSLSSRGVACLASSLLAAYLLFILGHQRVSGGQQTNSIPTWSTPTQTTTILTQENNSSQTTSSKHFSSISCFIIAIGTYYCFLVSFNWMFLLSYDIWRTLKLATCQLRAPALHSQSKRFLTYMLFALLGSGIIVGLSILIDLIPISCEQQTITLPLESNNENILEQQQQQQQVSSSLVANCTHDNKNSEIFDLSKFIQNYRPKFGQQAGSCWFSNRRALALFFGLPVTFIMILNLLFFLHSSFMVIKTSSRSSRHLKTSSRLNNSTSSNSSAGSSSKSANQKAPSSPKLISIISLVDSSTSSNCSTDTSGQDYAHQNSLTTSSMISVQTLQSHLSNSSDYPSGDEDSSALQQGGASESSSSTKHQSNNNNNGESNQVMNSAENNDNSNNNSSSNKQSKYKLESTQSSGSLTNQSIGASSSITASLAHKCDAHLQSLSSVMGSVIKDYRLYCRLSTIMGLTWLTGIMASVVDQSEILWYLFVVLNTLQGLFIFIAFGCKRSKLANLEILLNYAQFKFKKSRENWWQNKKKKFDIEKSIEN